MTIEWNNVPDAIRNGTLFLGSWYLRKHPDVARANKDPLEHYLTNGWRERRNPHPLFDVDYYLRENPDVAAAGIEPLTHYILQGWREWRNPNPFFESRWYAWRNGRWKFFRSGPLTHYINIGRNSGARSHRRQRPAAKPIVFMADSVFPRPDRDSGSLDQLSFIKIFHSLGFEVHFFAHSEFDMNVFNVPGHYVHNLEALGVHCITSRDYNGHDDYLFHYANRISVAFLSRTNIAEQLIDSVCEFSPRAKIIFNTVDLSFIRQLRGGELKNDQEMIAASEVTKRSTLALIRRAAATIVVSSYEKELLEALAPGSTVHLVPLIRDFEDNPLGSFAARKGIAFLGGYRHRPNVDAVEYFLAEVWPELHARRPDIEFLLAGSHCPPELTSRTDTGLRVVGYVEDLVVFLNSVRLTVAPLRYGAGAKGKVVSSLGYGVPCVASAIASEGMGLQPGHDISVADTPAEYIERICTLYDDEALWTKQSENGLATMRKGYSLVRGRELTMRVLERAGIALPADAASFGR